MCDTNSLRALFLSLALVVLMRSIGGLNLDCRVQASVWPLRL